MEMDCNLKNLGYIHALFKNALLYHPFFKIQKNILRMIEGAYQ